MAFVATRPSSFRIILKNGFKIEPGSTLLTGFHGLGEVGFLSTAHLTRTLKADRVGFIKSDMLPLFVSMENERLVLPFEIYSYAEKKMVFLVPRFQPHQSDQWNFIDRLADWIAENEFAETILLGGLDMSFKEEGDGDSIRCVPTAAYKSMVEKWAVPILEEGLFVAGPLALLLAELEMRDTPGIGLLSYATRGRPDPRSAATMLEKINDVFGVKANVDQLLEESREIERLEKMRKSIEERDDPASMYL
ncbi:MAG: proteasome assembly chaperone family protein [Candidatus Thorarchaeota archaeon]|nr:MAG: proteasome assembly chaperone family protein [Candidatus Thorarchaeota archaeon]